ncbi:MAG: hypothetical protein KGL39_42580 [Patescibacteria group bacterium]|nr:hypothetical protein [Patescibacteria group bacterium]
MDRQLAEIQKKLDELKARADALGTEHQRLQDHIAKAEAELAVARASIDEAKRRG